ncbi:MAG: hypothetical protein RL523_1030 [Actinomycetota bacterium]
MSNYAELAQKGKRLNWRKLNLAQDLVEAFGWLCIVYVVFTFLLNGGVAGIKDLQTALGSLERITALVASMLLLIQVLLISRVPWLDKLYGQDKATATHKKLGKPILYLVIAHAIAVIWSYSITDGVSVVDEFLSLLNTIPEIVLATIAFGLMITVVIASLNISRKKLSYEAWYLVHLLGYGAVMFAIPHQLIIGVDIAGIPMAQYFWITAYLFVALNIIWFRLLSPIILSATHKLVISKVESESSDSVSITITGKKLDKFNAESGQFFIVRVINATFWWRAHPFSLSAKPTPDKFRFTIGNRGDDTKLLQSVKPGTRVILEGPYGVFTESRRSEENVVLVAAGIGAPPIRALAESIQQGKVDIIYRVRDAGDAALLDELQDLADARGFKLHVLEGNRRSDSSWLPTSFAESVSDELALQNLVPYINKADVYICGPKSFSDSVASCLERVGTPKNRIHAEEFAW